MALAIDANTAQGGIGIAKAFNNVPLANLDALTYQWHVNEVNTVSPQAPTIHITVSGLTNDSHFGSGFANLVYNPTLNGITPARASCTSPTASRRTRTGTAPLSRTSTARAARTILRRSRRSWPTTRTR